MAHYPPILLSRPDEVENGLERLPLRVFDSKDCLLGFDSKDSLLGASDVLAQVVADHVRQGQALDAGPLHRRLPLGVRHADAPAFGGSWSHNRLRHG